MELQPLKVTVRDQAGKGPARQLRMRGGVPAVVYGLHTDPIKLRIDARELDHVLHGRQGQHAIVEVQVEGQPKLCGPAMIKDVQYHPVQGDVIHADLMRIDLLKNVHTHVAVRLEGQAVGVIEGGVLDHQLRELEISCLANEVPDYVAYDISHLNIGDGVHVRDLIIPENIELLTDLDRSVAAVHAPRVVLEAAADEEPVEGEEGAEAEAGAEGAEGAPETEDDTGNEDSSRKS